MTDNMILADLLFPEIKKTPEDLEEAYPPRELPQGAMVTRFAPSPTGFLHLGNLFGALVDERLAHQSGGVFYLRLEDTDQKRKVDGAVDLIFDIFRQYGLVFDEGYGSTGNYGPYSQQERAELYQTVAKSLVQKGLAYPCFCTEEELGEIRDKQAKESSNPGYYGKWAKHRDMPLEEIKKELASGKPFVLRLRSSGDPQKVTKVKDLVKGDLELPENDQDIVLLKSDGIPTYHFAHVVDDHFMRTTHVVRGEEWLSTFPWHLQLFEYLGWKTPYYIHTANMLKQEGEGKRKLSKRKDPEFSMSYYEKEGFPANAILEYLLTILNSNYEEWRLKNPDSPYTDFPFRYQKMSPSGALFDMDKLLDISKNLIAKMTAEEVYGQVLAWSEKNDAEFHELLKKYKEYSITILRIGRGGKKPRKDLSVWSKVREYMDFFYDELFFPTAAYPANIPDADIQEILRDYLSVYDPADDQNTWFEKMKTFAAEKGFAAEMKEYKKNPTDYKGHVGDIAMILRIAITGRTMSPDTYAVMKVMGKDRLFARIKAAADHIS